MAHAAALPPALAVLKTMATREQRQAKAREAMAMAANKLLSGPEDNVGELKVLNALLRDEDLMVRGVCSNLNSDILILKFGCSIRERVGFVGMGMGSV